MANQVEEPGSGPMVQWDTPLVHSSQEVVSTRNSPGGSIQSAAEWIEEFVQGERFDDLVEEAIAESYVEEERAILTPSQIGAIRHTLIGRALIAVAEEQFILAAGIVDD